MIKWLKWYDYLIDWCTPKLDSVVGAVAGPVIGGLMGGDSGSGGYQQAVPQFTPYNITTPYGSSTFDTAKKTAGYTLSPELQSFVDQYMAGAKAALPTQAQTQFANQVGNYGLGLFNQAAGMDTGKMASDYYNQQQALLSPQRQQQESQLADTLFKTGRTGAAAGVDGGYVNPEQFALLKAREQENAQLALGSEDRARALQNQQLANALNFYGQGQSLQTAPYATSANILGLGTNLQNLGQNALTIGSNIGSMQANTMYNAGQLGIAQQDAMNKANAQNAAYYGGIASNVFKNIGSSGTQGGWGWGTAATPNFNNPFNYNSAGDYVGPGTTIGTMAG